VAHSQEAHFRQHLSRVAEHLDMCDKLVGRIDQVDAEVASMLDKWRSVEEGGKSLQDASQKLLDERVRLVWKMYVRARTEGFEFDRINWWNCKRLSARLWNISRS
jgi:hypothetical protein